MNPKERAGEKSKGVLGSEKSGDAGKKNKCERRGGWRKWCNMNTTQSMPNAAGVQRGLLGLLFLYSSPGCPATEPFLCQRHARKG